MSVMLLSACSGAASGSTGKADAIDGRYQSSELRELLEKTRAEGTLLGHQDDLAYGSVWYGEQGRSDVKDVCGDYPAVFGWDISGIERGTGYTDDSVSVASVRKYIAEVAAMGGVSSVRWKACGAVDGESRDAALDSVASFLSGLRDSRGGVVPVIFQPVFDCDGADASMIRPLWRMARSRIANKAKNVLYAYSVSNPDSVADFERQYTHTESGDVPQQNLSGLTLDELEKQTILQALKNYGGNLSHVASSLGISRAALYRRLEKHGISIDK